MEVPAVVPFLPLQLWVVVDLGLGRLLYGGNGTAGAGRGDGCSCELDADGSRAGGGIIGLCTKPGEVRNLHKPISIGGREVMGE